MTRAQGRILPDSGKQPNGLDRDFCSGLHACGAGNDEHVDLVELADVGVRGDGKPQGFVRWSGVRLPEITLARLNMLKPK